MGEEQLRRAVDAATLPVVASLGPAGAVSAHWLPDRAGEPVVWVRVKDEASRVAVESYAWVLPQVQIILTRLNVPPEMVMRLRMEVTSAEAEERLFDR